MKYIDEDLRAFFQPLEALERRSFATLDDCAQRASDALNALTRPGALQDYLFGNKKHLYQDPFDPGAWMKYASSSRKH